MLYKKTKPVGVSTYTNRLLFLECFYWFWYKEKKAIDYIALSSTTKLRLKIFVVVQKVSQGRICYDIV